MAMNVVFDFGAVLFTWKPERLVAAHFSERAATPAAARKLAVDIFHHEDWQAFDAGTAELPSVVARTSTRLSLPHTAMQALVSQIPEHLLPIPDTVALLRRLVERRAARNDIRLYYLSNMPAPYARVLQQRHDFLNWFDGGLFSGDVRLVKPQPEIFRLIESRYALAPAQTVFIDDLLANVESARTGGWHAFQFHSAAQLEPELLRHLD